VPLGVEGRRDVLEDGARRLRLDAEHDSVTGFEEARVFSKEQLLRRDAQRGERAEGLGGARGRVDLGGR
jgi:hypothetical protein